MEKIEKYMKQALKNKVKITKALMIAFLINGGFSLAENNPITPGTNLGGENATAIGAGSVSAGSESSSIGTNTFASGNNMTKEEYLKFLKDNKERLSKIELKMQEIKNDKDEIQKLRQEHDDIVDKIDRINNYKKTIEDKEKELNEKEPQILKTIEEKRTEAIKFTKEIEDLEKRIDIISQLDFSKINEENKAQGVEILAKDLKQKMEEGQTWLKQYGENGIPLDEYKNAVLSYIDGEKKENIENKMLEILQNYNKGKQNTNFNVVDVIDGFRLQNHLFEYVKVELSFNIPPIFSIFNFLHHFKNIGIQEDGKLYFNNNDEFLEVTKDNMIKYAYNTDLSYFFYHNGLNIEPELFETERQELINWYKKTNKGYANPFNVNIKNFKEYYDIITNETLPIPDRYNSETVKTARQYLKETKELYDNIYKIQESKTTDDFELLKLKKYKSELNKINEKYTTNKKDKIMPIIQVIYDKIQGVSTFNSKSINISDIYSEKYIEDLIKKTRSEFPKKIANSDELLKLWEKYNQKVPNSNLTKVYQDEIDRLKGLEKDANTFITEKEELIKGYKNDIENLKSLLNSENPSDVEEVNKQIQEKEEKIKKALSDIENLKKNLTEIKPGTNALAYGTNSAALGKDSIAFGTNNIAINESSIAFGTNNFVNGNKSIALGYGHKVIGENSISFGVDLLTTGNNNTNVGQLSQVNGEKNQVVGFSNEVKGDQNLVVGNNNRAISNGQVSSIAKVTFIDRNNKDHIIYVPKHTALKEVPNPSLPDKGYFFKDWNLDRKGTGTSVTKDTIVDDDMIVYQIDDKLPPLIIDGGEFNVNMDRSSRVRTRRSAFSTPHPDITLIPRRSPDTNPSESTPKAMTPIINENVLQGNRNEVFGNGNLVFGSENKVGTETKGVMNNILFGNKIDATSVNNAIVFGNESKPIEGAVSFGNDTTTRQLKFVAKGTDDTDAVNFSQLKDYVKKHSKGKTVNIKNELLSKLNYDPDTYLKIDKTYLQYITDEKGNIKIPDTKKLSLNIDGVKDALGKDSDIANPKDKFVTDTKVHDYVTNNFVSKDSLDVTKLLKSSDVDVTGDNKYITVTNEDNTKKKYKVSFNESELTSTINNSDFTSNKSIQDMLGKKADKDASNLDTKDVENWQNKLGNGTVTDKDNGLVKGSTVFTYINNIKQQLSTKASQDLNTKLNVDADNLSDKGVTNLTTKLGTGAITDNNTELVKGGVVKTYVDNKLKDKLSSSDVDVTGDDYITVNTVLNKPNHYKLAFNKEQLASDLDLSKNTKLTEQFNKYALLDGSNLTSDEFNLNVWQNKLGNGEVKEGDTGLITGGKVYEVKKELNNKYTTLNNQVTTNTNDISKLKTDVEDLKNTKQDITNINNKLSNIDKSITNINSALDGKLDKTDLSIKGDKYIDVKKDNKFNYTLTFNKTNLENDLDLTNNTSINNMFTTKLGDINTNIGELKTKVKTNTNNINSLTTKVTDNTNKITNLTNKVDTNTKDIDTLKQDMTKKLNVDANNLTIKGETNLINKLSKGSDISKPNNKLVTDTQVNTFLNDKFKNFSTNIDNRVINTLQQGVNVVNNKADLALAKSDLALTGISNAVAMANLPQVASYGKYKHMLTAAYGNYAGVNALALGLSGTTDSRRITYKISGSVNTKGNLAFGTGIGVMLGEIHDGNVDTPSHVKEQLIKSEKERQLMRTALIKQENKAKQQEDQIKDLYRIIGELQNQLKNNEKTKESIEKH